MNINKMDGLSITDLIWNSSNFVLDLKENKDPVTLDFSQNEFSDKIPRPSKALVDIKQYKKLLEIKEKIPNCAHWDKWSKLVNPYDKIQYLAKNKNTKDYYKFFEIFKYFGISEVGSSAHMGESSLHSAKALAYFMPKINWYANVEPKQKLTINKSQTDLNKMLENDMENSKDDNGYSRLIHPDPNSSTIENLKNFRETTGKVNIVIGDCTTDTAHDPNNQEQLVFYLLFAQVVTGLHIQLRNGHMIIKIFDTITRPTCQLIYYLTNFYENVSIIKPRTSRYTNSEKFIVARNFKGILNEELKAFDKIMSNWNSDQFFRVMGIDIPEEIETQFLNYNKNIIENQHNYIEKTIRCNYNEEEIPDKQLEAFQNKNALLFCSNFGIPVNLSDSDISVCKHIKKKKIHIAHLKNTMVCEKCFSFILVKN
jgi:23S rRNA U2552 (ribose-2'-O)-methylase RlmE/FtsJ